MSNKKLIITIDTEEDQWGLFQPHGHSVKNIERIPKLQQLFDEFGARPVYLVTFAVATDNAAAAILHNIFLRGGCEIGAHCHPWNTPPFEEETGQRNSMLCNLPSPLQFKKLESLHLAIKNSFGVEPTSFRSGRWGYNTEVAKNLQRLGYTVDSSITAYTDWRAFFGPDFSDISSNPYRFNPASAFTPNDNGVMTEIPATVDYLRGDSALCNRIYKFLIKSPMNRMRLIGLLHWSGILRKVHLTPELSNGDDMTALAKKLIKSGHSILNMYFHSTSLQAGLSSFVKTEDDEKLLFARIRQLLQFAKDNGIESATLSESRLTL